MDTNIKAFETKEQYVEFREAFRKLAREKKVNSKIMLIFHTIRGKGPYFGFTPITNPIKLASNCDGKPWFNHEIRINAIKTMITSPSSWSIREQSEINTLLGGKITENAWKFLAKHINDEVK
jgi:hypothetical protein